MMTMLVTTLGLLSAALSQDIGSDSQRTFAIVVVGGWIADLGLSIFLLPTFYVWWTRPTDHLATSLVTIAARQFIKSPTKKRRSGHDHQSFERSSCLHHERSWPSVFRPSSFA
jgi:hypothetical protein